MPRRHLRAPSIAGPAGRVALVAAAIAFAGVALGATAASDEDARMPMSAGPFQPSWASLMAYHCPRWFRNAKFGIWAHWSPQCVPEQGDWYARNMYIQGTPQYNYNVKHYGHPSKFGYKDLCHLWKADKWDPDKLIRLYKAAGAQYFVALANHHDGFDCWDSKYQEWNSVRVGPHKDIVGIWARTARKYGLRFGVTVHSARTWSWFNVSHGSDKTGPLAGVPYDGNLTKADGIGKWWQGLDPRELYYAPHADGTPPPESYVVKWYDRTRDLVDRYHPDLLYFDDTGLPLGDAGLRIAAHFYNSSAARHGGRPNCVLTTKGLPPDERKAVTWDIERGFSDRIEPYPWQTDTCIGDWHYLRGAKYKSADTVVHMLCDIVSKNGNLLLNIPVRGNGTIDKREMAFLRNLTAWMKINSECIFDTRPWIVFGEGPSHIRGGYFNEGQARHYTSRDIRFTLKGRVLYAIALGWPADGKFVVRSLARLPQVTGQITGVRLLGYPGKLKWADDDAGLRVTLPARKPCDYAYVLKITGHELWGFRPDLVPPEEAPPVSPDAQGNLILTTDTAELHGTRIQFERRTAQENIGYWDRPSEWVSWRLRVPAAATYEVTADCATGAGASALSVEVADKRLDVAVPATGDWDRYTTVKGGAVTIDKPGEYVLSVKPRDAATWRPINLTAVRLTKVR